MPKLTLTARSVENAKPPAAGQVEYFDAALPGFALRVTDKGRKSWVLFYRVRSGPEKGKQRRLTLGTYPLLSLAEARRAAQDALAAVERGGDPAGEKREVKATPAPIVHRFAAVAEAFLEEYARVHKRERSWQEDERNLRRHVTPKWGERPIGSITRADVDELIDGIAKCGTPIAANRVLAVVRTLFNWALTKPRFALEASPVVRIAAPGAEISRDRWLKDEELRPLWLACEEQGHPFGRFAQLLLLTAQRREAVAALRWCDLDLKERLWTVPGAFMKSGREHVVPLSALAAEIIGGMPRFDGVDWLFPATRARAGRAFGERHVSGYSDIKARLDAAMLALARKEAAERGCDPEKVQPVLPWRFHDLRRTATTHMGQLRVPRHIRKLILDHVERDVTGIYDRYEYLDERREALELWAAKIERLIGSADQNVVPLRA